jgi:hypothetical protein
VSSKPLSGGSSPFDFSLEHFDACEKASKEPVKPSTPQIHPQDLTETIYSLLFTSPFFCQPKFADYLPANAHTQTMNLPSQLRRAGQPSAKIGLAAALRSHKTGLKSSRSSQKTKKGAANLVQSDINPIIISIFLQKSHRENACFEGQIDLFRPEIDIFGAFFHIF